MRLEVSLIADLSPDIPAQVRANGTLLPHVEDFSDLFGDVLSTESPEILVDHLFSKAENDTKMGDVRQVV